MTSIAFVDHSYHQKTRSSEFMSEILRNFGHAVDCFWDESWKGGKPVKFEEVINYDVVVMFQSVCETKATNIRSLHPNVIFIPMLDNFDLPRGPHWNLSQYWERFQGSKILSFSRAMHGMAVGAGLYSFCLQFWPKPAAKISVPQSGLHGFFWLRRQDMVSWATVRALIGNEDFDSFHLHYAPDPQAPKAILPSDKEQKKYRITTSNWFHNKDEFNRQLLRANIYFAPRDAEGIGQGFLEAMANSQCVIAPDHGTMNEYISHGINGLLYDTMQPTQLDFSNARKLAKCAHNSSVSGYQYWNEQAKKLNEFILKPSDEFYEGKYRHHISHGSIKLKLLNQSAIKRFTQWLGK